MGRRHKGEMTMYIGEPFSGKPAAFEGSTGKKLKESFKF